MKNFHLRLPKQTYSRLKAAAERTQMPATALAREAIVLWLRLQVRKSGRQAIAAYAGQMAVPISTSTPSWSRPEFEHLVRRCPRRSSPPRSAI